MKKIIFIISSLLILGLVSCNKFDKSKITVIDGVVLGQPTSSFLKSLDSIGIKKEVFCTDFLFDDMNKVIDSRLNFYFSEQFDLSEFQGDNVHHLGLYNPVQNEAQNITELYILLTSTCQPLFIYDKSIEVIKNMGFSRGVKQEVNILLLDQIELLLTEKYGKPIQTINSNENAFFAIKGSSINAHTNKNSYTDKIIWETNELRITLFKGINCDDTYYNSLKRIYMTNLSGEKNNTTNESDIPCKKYPYVSYQIKYDIIKELKLDGRKL